MINRNDIDINSLFIKDVIDIDLLQSFQDNFAESMNIASITVDNTGTPVTKSSHYTDFCKNFIHSTEKGTIKCAESHKKAGEKAAKLGRPYIHVCHAGLIDFAAPILIQGIQIGTILGGQVFAKDMKKFPCIQAAKKLGIGEEKIIDPLNKININSKNNIKAAAEVLFIIANALSKIGYEELQLKKLSKDLEIELLKKSSQLEESNEYNRSKTQLFATISHELKTPLNIIYSSLQLVESLYKVNPSAPLNDIFLKYLNIMKQNCCRLVRLINNMIDINKVELGFLSLKLNNIDIIKVIEDITLSIVSYAKLKNINVIFDTEIEEKIIACDLDKIERIMLNLLSNSIKFNKKNGYIYVNIYDKKEYIWVSVRDTGIGIPENMLDKIFDIFTQVDNSFRRNNEGSGIGLSLVKSFVEKHGGEISVTSQLNKGSEFIIKLPVRIIEKSVETCNDEFLDLNNNIEKIKIEFSDIYL